MTWVVPLVVLVPAAAALLGLLVRRSRAASRAVAVWPAAAVVVLAFLQYVAPARSATIETLGSLPLVGLDAPLHLLSDRHSGLVALAVALVVLAVQVYSTWYLAADERYGVFAATVSLFAAGMLLVVQSADLLLTLVGWEIMGWCSWLLIGHHSERPAARRAAYKAFLVTRLADVGMVVGLVALAARAGSTDLEVVKTQPGATALLTVGLVGVAIGVAGKSGLVPFHDWLPDAMEGPTPASALIHAATMVAAGSYVIARLFELYAADETARLLLAVLAAVTMVWAALLAFAQVDLKRLLAYSTLSQVAIMVAGLAAAPDALGIGPSIGHLVGHAFFKALLFLAAGWLAVLVGSTLVERMRGRLAGRGALRWGIGIGLAALAGVPPLIGFFTKDTVVDAALEGWNEGGGFASGVVVVALFATVVLTAAYCARVWLVLDVGRQEAGERPATVEAHEPHAGPITFPAALVVSALAVLTVVGTFLLLGLSNAVHVGLLTAFVSVVLVVAAAGVVVALGRMGRADPADRLPLRVRELAVAGFGIDRAYVAVANAVTAVARLVVVLDRDVVDAYPRASAVTTRALGRLGERAHRGVPATALLGLIAGAVLVAVLGVTQWR